MIITGSSRRDPGRQAWKESLGDYPEEFTFLVRLHFYDLDNVKTLSATFLITSTIQLISYRFLPRDMVTPSLTSKKQDSLDDPEHSRVVIEKPFGYDFKSAGRLQSVVERHLREKQVYRIDHYLGKDTVNNILATRFSNIILEPLWNRQYIEEVQIFATETIGCEGRSQYYETSGAVRDMLQNHMLQVLALVAMEAPCRMNARELRREKTKVLAATRLGTDVILGQYDGYKF